MKEKNQIKGTVETVKVPFEPLELEIVDVKVEKGYAASGSSESSFRSSAWTDNGSV